MSQNHIGICRPLQPPRFSAVLEPVQQIGSKEKAVNITRGPKEGRRQLTTPQQHNAMPVLRPDQESAEAWMQNFMYLCCHASYVAPDLTEQQLSHKVWLGACRGRQLSLHAYHILAAAVGLNPAKARWSWSRAHVCKGRNHLQLCPHALLTLAAVHNSLLELVVLPAQLQQGRVLRANHCQSLKLGRVQVGALSSLHQQCPRCDQQSSLSAASKEGWLLQAMQSQVSCQGCCQMMCCEVGQH